MRMDTTVTSSPLSRSSPRDGAASRTQRQQAVVKALLRVLPEPSVLWRDEAVTPFECDGLSAYRQRPLAVAMPETHEQVGAVLRACHELGVPVVARGGGTGLSGGALPHDMGVTL
jgi:glycolate oxidase